MDIFILAGQSNMAGRGPVEDLPRKYTELASSGGRQFSIRSFNSSFVWTDANEPLHADIDLRKRHRCGVGPGLVCMYELKNQYGWERELGVVPCAIGGVSLEEWLPDFEIPQEKEEEIASPSVASGMGNRRLVGHGDDQVADIKGISQQEQQRRGDEKKATSSAAEPPPAPPNAAVPANAAAALGVPAPHWDYCPGAHNLYSAAVARGRAALAAAPAGSRLAGVLWYQGETDAMRRDWAETYLERFAGLVAALRRDLGAPGLPVYTVALTTAAADRLPFWRQVRAAQLGAAPPPRRGGDGGGGAGAGGGGGVPGVHVADAWGLPLLPDGLHLTTAAQVILGGNLAKLVVQASEQSKQGNYDGQILEPSYPEGAAETEAIFDGMHQRLQTVNESQSLLSRQANKFLNAAEVVEGSADSNEVLSEEEKERRQASQKLGEDWRPPTNKPLPLFQKKRRYVNFVYGEIQVLSLCSILARGLGPLPPPPPPGRRAGSREQEGGGVFYDLGCGAGRAVYAAALTHPYTRAAGVDLMQGYLKDATDMQEIYSQFYHQADEGKRLSMTIPANLHFIYGDILDVDWSDGTIIFVCSTCFDSEQMLGIAKKAELNQTGTLVVTLDKELPSDKYQILSRMQCHGSWGEAVAHIQILASSTA